MTNEDRHKTHNFSSPAWERIKLKLLLVGPAITSRFYAQFLKTMTNLVGNCLPPLRVLELSRDATQSRSLSGHRV